MLVGILGGSGYIGTWLTNHLKGEGHDVVSFTRQDFGDEKICLNIEELTFVICLIGSPNAHEGITNPWFDIKNNFEAPTQYISQLIREGFKGKWIVFSSAGIYGEQRPGLTEFKFSPYALTKLALEQWVNINLSSYVILRPFSVYGPGLRKQFVHSSFLRIRNGNNELFWGYGDELRSYVYIEDLVKVVSDIIMNFDYYINDTLDVLGETAAIKDIALLTKSILKSNFKIQFNGKTNPYSPRDLYLGKSNVKYCKTPLKEGLLNTLKSYEG